MGRRLAILAGAFMVAGCGRGTIARVYLDIDRVAQGDPIHFVEASPAPKPPPATPGSSLQIEPLPARHLDFSENRSRIEKVRAAVDQARERTINEVARKLREAYQSEIDAIETKRMAELGPIRTAALEKAWSQVRTRFNSWADARAPDVIRVALYSGFPDAATRRILNLGQKAIVRQQRLAQESRARIEELDARYDADVRSLLATYDDEVAAAITGIRVEIEKMRAAAEDRARNDAMDQAASFTEEIESVLAGSAQVELPARPGRSASTQAGSAPLEAPHVAFPDMQGSIRSRREAVRSEARIWAAHHGYELVDAPAKGEDRTDAFIVWRKQHHLGP